MFFCLMDKISFYRFGRFCFKPCPGGGVAISPCPPPAVAERSRKPLPLPFKPFAPLWPKPWEMPCARPEF